MSAPVKPTPGLWTCKRGHTYDSPIPITGALCQTCANDPTYKGSTEMRPVSAVVSER